LSSVYAQWVEGVIKKSIYMYIYSGGEEINNQIWLATKVEIRSWRFKTSLAQWENPLAQPVNHNM